MKTFTEKFDRLHASVCAYADEKTLLYTGRNAALEECLRALRDNSVVALVGAPGMGTSSLLYAFGKKYADRYHVFRAVGGFDAMTDLGSDVLQFFVHELENELEVAHSAYTADTDSVRHSFSVLIARLYRRTGKECLFLLDEADQIKLDMTDLAVPQYSRFVAVSHSDNSLGYPAFPLSVQSLTNEEARSILEAQLRHSGVEITPALTEALMKKTNMHNCSFIKMCAQKLENEVNYNGKNGDDLVEIADKIPDALGWDVYAFTTEVGEATTLTMQKGAMALIVLGRHGFSRELPEYIFSHGGLVWDDALFDKVIAMLRSYFFVNGETIRLSSPWMRDNLYTCFGGGTHEISGQILVWLKQLDETEEVRADELLHHCRLCGDNAFAAEYLDRAAASDDLRAVTVRELRKLPFYDGGLWLRELIPACSAQARKLIQDALEGEWPVAMAQTLCKIYKSML